MPTDARIGEPTCQVNPRSRNEQWRQRRTILSSPRKLASPKKSPKSLTRPTKRRKGNNLPNLTLLPAVIEAGQSLSEPVDCSAGQLVRITMPAGWDKDVALTFELSSDGAGYNPLHEWTDGSLLGVLVTPGSTLLVPDTFKAFNFIKLRSGTPALPRTQSERREFSLAILTS